MTMGRYPIKREIFTLIIIIRNEIGEFKEKHKIETANRIQNQNVENWIDFKRAW